MTHSLQDQFGNIDIYLFDQILRRRIVPGMRIFDAGCGSGRNLIYFLNQGYDVYAVDADPQNIPRLPPDHFRQELLEAMSYPSTFADVVLSNAVLHFARDDHHFQAMLQATWRILKPGGLFFCRLASSIGIESQILPLQTANRFLLPDGSERYLVDERTLEKWTRLLGGSLADPIKTTVVQNQRSMSTWVVLKN